MYGFFKCFLASNESLSFHSSSVTGFKGMFKFIDVCKNAKLMLRVFDKKHLPGTEVSEALTMLKYPMEQTKFTLSDQGKNYILLK